METDPIMERREQEAKLAKVKSLKTVMYVLAGVAVLLAVALIFIWSQKSSLIRELEVEKQDLTAQMENLQNDYASLSSDYDSINSQLDTSRAEVANLLERIKKTDATNRAKMRQYEKELGTLRSIMRNYIVQIDSLNTLNHKLTADAAAAVSEQQEQTQKILSVLPLHDFKVNDELTKDELKVFNSKIWEQMAAGCLSCCTCTYVCPTCHCYDIRDYQETEERTQRYRCWDSCMAKDFTLMAHGSPRKTKVERFRQRYMHKLVYFPENNDGEYACVGCGRCLQKCPVQLNIVKVAKALEKAEVKQDV